MTPEEAHREIFHAILECELLDAHGNTSPAMNNVTDAKALATGLLKELQARNLLIKLDDDD